MGRIWTLMALASAPPSLDHLAQDENTPFSTAPFPSSKPPHTQPSMPSLVLRKPSRIEMHATSSPRRKSARGSVDKTCGSYVEPGTPLSKAQIEARKDSVMEPLGLDGHNDPKPQSTRASFAELARKMRLDSSQLDIFNPEADPLEDFGQRQRPGNLRALIIFAMSFLIVFGSIYSLVEYLLFATSASASCTPSTVYIPVTRSASASAGDAASNGSTTPVTIYSTTTAVETLTSYVTIQPSVVVAGLTSSGGPSYYFTVNSAGSTGWLNGISPPATASLTVITRSIYVTPVMPTASTTASDSTTTATITSTATILQTLTVPAYTSTEYSEAKPHTTVTSTSTHYVTYTVDRVSETGPGTQTTGPRASYSGLGSSGWNMTSATSPSGATGVAAAADFQPKSTTLTEIHYFGDGMTTTSTSTRFITTSIQVAYPTTITPAIPEPSESPELVTTITALPVTITYSGVEGFSTSIAFNATAVSTIKSSTGGRASSPFQTGASATTSTPSIGTSPVQPVAPSSSSAMFTNSTSAALTVSPANYSPGVSLSSISSSQATTSSDAAAGPMTASSSPDLSVSTSLPTGSGPISTSTSVVPLSSGFSTTNPSSVAATTPTSSSSSVSSPTALTMSDPPSVSSGANATMTSVSSKTSSSAASSQVATSGIPSLPPAYGSYTPSPLQSSQVTAGAESGSVSSSSSAAPTISSATSSSIPVISSPPLSATWSTSVRTASNLAATTASPSQSISTVSASNVPSTSGRTVLSLSSSPRATSGSTSSIIVVSHSQTYIPSTTSTLPGIPASAASSMPSTGCGEYGDFMLNFDNLPEFTPTNSNQTDIMQAPPIQNPYHHFAFSDGYVYAPDPRVPYEPISPPHLAVFLGNGTGMRATQASAHTIEDGEFADGPYEASQAFWFDALSGWFGCDNQGPEVCTLVMSAYTYNSKEDDEVLAFQKNATVEGCPGYKDCKLKKIEFPDTFKALSGLQAQAFVGKEERMFFMDDVALRWTDNSCIAGLTRQRAR